MKYGQRVDESEMVALFLRSELKSERWADAIRKVLAARTLPDSLITNPDTSDAAANQQRAHVLGDFRGYKENRDLFSGYPEDVDWHQVLLERNDFGRLKYVDYSYWNEITDGSRRPHDAVDTILKGKKVYGVSNQPAIDGAESVRAGLAFDPIILVTTDVNSDLVILEGHSRVTVYALAGSDVPTTIRALMGLSQGFASWF